MQETRSKPDVAQLRALVEEDSAAVDGLIKARLYSDVVLINQLSHYIISSVGKRLRPLLYAMWNGNEQERALVRSTIEQGGLEKLDEIMAAIESTGAITYTFARAQDEAEKALNALEAIPNSKYRNGLETLVEFAVHRTS